MMRSFNFTKDVDVLNGWLLSRNLNQVKQSDLPKFGLMAHEDEEPLGCVFLRHCENDVGMLCSFEINPSLGLKLKDKVFEELLMCGKELAHIKGVRRLMAMSEKKSILKRLEKMGWKASSYKIAATVLLEGI